MALSGVPWATGNGAENAVEDARSVTYFATNGGRGVSGPTHMKVVPYSVPGAGVRVLSGGWVSPNDYLKSTGFGAQSYAGRETSHTDVPVPATGSAGGATRYLIVRVSDPQYAGNPPADVVNGPYVSYQLVSRLDGLTYPHVPLAKIVQPASTGTITAGMITDIRSVANPRVEDHVIARPVVLGDISGYSHILRQRKNGSGVRRGEQFPDQAHGGRFELDCPDWATRMIVECVLSGVVYTASSSWGGWYIAYETPGGTPRWSQDFGWDIAEDESANNRYRYKTNWIMSEELPVYTEQRGKKITFDVRAFVDTSTGAKTGQVSLDGRSGLTFKCRFLERADTALVS